MDQLRKTTYIIIAVALGTALLYFSREVLMPLAIAGLLAMLFRGVAGRLEARGWPRWLTSIGAVLVFLAGIGIVVGLLSWQLSALTENAAEMRERVNDQLTALRNWVQETAGISHSEQEEIVEEQAQSAASGSGGGMAAFAMGTFDALLNIVLIIVYTLLLLYYRTKIKNFIIEVTPKAHRSNAHRVIEKASGVAEQYLIGLAAMIACLWVLYGIGFSIVGVEGALFFAVLCGILEIVPFFGNLLGTMITILAVIVQGGKQI